jgi:peptide/nickel transport system substrate-binding protein
MQNFSKLRATFALVLGVFVVFSSFNCTQVQKENSISYGIATQPDHLDPFLAASADSRVVLFNIFEGLFKPSPEGEIVPAVASSFVVTPDSSRYRVTLREGVKFHTGELVTMVDVVESLEKAREAKLLNDVASVAAVDEKTLEITLTQGDSEFYYNLTTAIVPAGYAEQNTAPVGTGPFKFVSFTPQQEVVLAKNEFYWNPALPKVDSFTFKIKADYNSIVLDLKAKTLDAGTVDSLGALQLDARDYDLLYDNINAPQILVLNNKVAPFDDVRVRQAMAFAVDVQEIVTLVHHGHAERAASPVIPGLRNAYAKDLDAAYPHNVEKAQALLAEAGVGAFSLTITVPSNYEPHVQTAEVIVNQLAAVGVTAKVQLVDWATWLTKVYTGRNYEATVISIDGTTLSPRSYLARYESTSRSNFVNYANPEYDALWAQALTSSDGAVRTGVYKDLQRILSADAASVYLCDISSPKVFRKGVSGYTSYPLYVFDASTLKVQ